MDEPFKFEQLVQFRVPTNLSTAIDQAAKKKCQSRSDYVRQSIISRLETDGVVVAKPRRDAGALYDSLEGKRRFAWVEAGEIKAMSYSADRPADDWLPVVHVDSEPFDAARHWRLAPVYTIDADKVTCTYPVVVKSLEVA